MRRHAFSAAAGAVGGLATGAWLWVPRDVPFALSPPVSPLVGTYQLTSCEPAPAGHITGLMVHQPDGTVSSQVIVKSGGIENYVGYSGRWWVNDASVYGPFFRPMIDHDIRASSLPRLVGKTLRQEYELSADGCKLTTSSVSITGQPRQEATLRWQRLEH